MCFITSMRESIEKYRSPKKTAFFALFNNDEIDFEFAFGVEKKNENYTEYIHDIVAKNTGEDAMHFDTDAIKNLSFAEELKNPRRKTISDLKIICK